MQNGDVYEANIKDIDKKSDIATIKVNPQVGRPAAWLGASSDPPLFFTRIWPPGRSLRMRDLPELRT